MKDNKEYSINIPVWIFAILAIPCIIAAIMNFDTEQWLTCSIIILVVILWESAFLYKMFKDIIYLINKEKTK